jgi:hypothetical protein
LISPVASWTDDKGVEVDCVVVGTLMLGVVIVIGGGGGGVLKEMEGDDGDWVVECFYRKQTTMNNKN